MADMKRDPLNPFPWYEVMRREHPVFYDQMNGLWHVFRYRDVKRVLSDYHYFSSAEGRNGNANNPIGSSIISSDPPRHTHLRSLVSKVFTPRRVEQLAPRIRQVAEEILNALKDGNGFDLVKEFSGPLPVIVIAEMLGIPPSDRGKFRRWSDQLVSGTREDTSEEAGEFSNPQLAMASYFTEVIENKRKNPGNDLISSLIDSEVDGEKLSPTELLGFCILLLVAGNETTTNLITNSIMALSENNDQYDAVVGNPDLISRTIEEVLRFKSPVQSMFRTCTAETEIDGQKIRKGDALLAWIGSANRDTDEFEDAGEFRVERDPNRHLAFGEGVHFCLGAPLARLEAGIALETLFEHLGKLEIDPEFQREPVGGIIVYGVRSLPVTISRKR